MRHPRRTRASPERVKSWRRERPDRGPGLDLRAMEKRRRAALSLCRLPNLAPTTDGYSRAVISRVRTPRSSTYQSTIIVLIAGLPGPEHDDFRADRRAVVEIDNVLVRQADAAGRDVGANGPGFICAVDAV